MSRVPIEICVFKWSIVSIPYDTYNCHASAYIVNINAVVGWNVASGVWAAALDCAYRAALSSIVTYRVCWAMYMHVIVQVIVFYRNVHAIVD